MDVYRRDTTSLLEGLSPAQQEAVQTVEGPLLVLAGAGSGKTRVITRRIAYLLAKGVQPEAVLAVTFTRKAAQEMRARVSALLGGTVRGLSISTFHALGYRMLREQAYRLPQGQGLQVYGDKERFQLMGRLLGDENLDELCGIDTALAEISRAKNQGMTPEQFLAEAENPVKQAIGQVYARYQAALEEQHAIDLDDMVLQPLRLLDSHERLRRLYSRRWRFLLIDEYQDTNAGQYRLAQYLAGEGRNICAVGDDDQSIYRFRGADVERIRHFAEDFPGARVLQLEVNYRSSAEIVRLGHAVMVQARERYPKRLVPALGPSVPVEWTRVASEEDEGRLTAGEISRLRSALPLGDIAVLVRVERDGSGVMQALRREHIPCQRGQGSEEDRGVCVMTIHQPKGLEFPVVFLPTIEDETIPHYYALQEGGEAIEEERRLLYVAITRAKTRLFLSSCRSRNQYDRRPTRFLSGIESGGFLVRH
jgi:DNA helicase II / ATP-dependent DNA helicase PcrA